jgi:hypothetical protein
MTETTVQATTNLLDRRSYGTAVPPLVERRQFGNSYDDLSSPARELAQAVDEYKLRHRRRFISYEEMLAVILDLGYHKD